MNFTIERNGLYFCVDYYVELLGILYILCEDQDAVCEAGIPLCNEEYVQEVKDYFRNSNYYPLTKTLEQFSDEFWFNYDAPVQLMLMLSNNSPIDKETLFHERKPIPDELFDRFLSDLQDFEREAGFAAFYRRHIPMYETIASRFIADYQKYNSHEFLLSFLNRTPDCVYYINFMVGITNANYGATIGNRVYANIRPYDESRYAPMPDYSMNPIYYSTLILHEFAHSFINAAVAHHRPQIQSIDISRYDADLEGAGYGDSIETLINETIIRAIECIYVKEKFPASYDPYVTFNVEEGYSKLKDVIAASEESVNIEKIIHIFSR